jgi:TonB family protein
MLVFGTLADPCSAQEANAVHDADISSVRIVSTDKKPTTVVKPIYPEAAKKAGVQGLVVLDIVIGRTGEVEMARAISGPKKLRSAAAEAVKQWKWEPFLLNEKPIQVRTQVVVNFCLGCAKSPEHE